MSIDTVAGLVGCSYSGGMESYRQFVLHVPDLFFGELEEEDPRGLFTIWLRGYAMEVAHMDTPPNVQREILWERGDLIVTKDPGEMSMACADHPADCPCEPAVTEATAYLLANPGKWAAVVTVYFDDEVEIAKPEAVKVVASALKLAVGDDCLFESDGTDAGTGWELDQLAEIAVTALGDR